LPLLSATAGGFVGLLMWLVSVWESME